MPVADFRVNSSFDVSSVIVVKYWLTLVWYMNLIVAYFVNDRIDKGVFQSFHIKTDTEQIENISLSNNF